MLASAATKALFAVVLLFKRRKAGGYHPLPNAFGGQARGGSWRDPKPKKARLLRAMSAKRRI